MENRILGVHHITAIATDTQANVDFYTNVLGLRLVKKTVNFDDPQTYHLYYGDETGTPGTLLTFFPWSAQAARGRKGTGQGSVFSFSVPSDALDFWEKRLDALDIPHTGRVRRFDDEVMTILDRDEFEIELVANGRDTRQGREGDDIPARSAIRGFFSAAVSEQHLHATAGFIQAALGFEKVAEEGGRHRYEVGNGGPGTYLDIMVQPGIQRGVMGAGMIHHIAFRTPDEKEQAQVRSGLVESHHNVTEVADRQYFKSIYFHEPGGVLFEVATDTPGFMIDETRETLGTHLKLPPWLEKHRRAIEQSLPPLTLAQIAGVKT